MRNVTATNWLEPVRNEKIMTSREITLIEMCINYVVQNDIIDDEDIIDELEDITMNLCNIETTESK